MKLLQAAGKILSIISIGFVVWFMAKMDYTFWKTLPKDRVVTVIVGCAVIYALFFRLLAVGWFLLLKALSPQAKAIPNSVLQQIYMKSNLMKYLPGNVLEFVGRNIFTSKYGVSHKQIALASLIETVLIIFVSVTLGVITGFDILKDLLVRLEISSLFDKLSLLAVLGVLAVVGGALYVLSRKIKDLGISPEKIRTLGAASCKVFLLQSLVFINLSLTFFFIFTYGFSMKLGFQDFLFILSGFTLSWTMGFVTPGAPGGLGVKELGLVSLLATRFGSEATIIASVLHRIISVIGDVLAYAISAYGASASGSPLRSSTVSVESEQ